MKRYQKLAFTVLMAVATFALSACRANLGNFFDLW